MKSIDYKCGTHIKRTYYEGHSLKKRRILGYEVLTKDGESCGQFETSEDADKYIAEHAVMRRYLDYTRPCRVYGADG